MADSHVDVKDAEEDTHSDDSLAGEEIIPIDRAQSPSTKHSPSGENNQSAHCVSQWLYNNEQILSVAYTENYTPTEEKINDDEGEELSEENYKERRRYSMELRMQNPDFTHRICFLNEEDINKNFSDEDDEEGRDRSGLGVISDAELNESLRRLVKNYTSYYDEKIEWKDEEKDHLFNKDKYNDRVNETNDMSNQHDGNKYFKSTVASSFSLPVISFSKRNSPNTAANTYSATSVKETENRLFGGITRKAGLSNSFSWKLFSFARQPSSPSTRSPQFSDATHSKNLTAEDCERSIELILQFLNEAKELEKDAKFALGQAKAMAQMQVQLECTNTTSSLVLNKVLCDIERKESLTCQLKEENGKETNVYCKGKETNNNDVPIKDRLLSLSHSDLLNVIKSLKSAIEKTNLVLVEGLILKDSLKTQQEHLLAEIEDLTKHAENQLHELQLLLNSDRSLHE